MYSLKETKNKVTHLGVAKVNKPFLAKFVLGFSAGAMISFGYLAYLQAVNTLGAGIGNLVGASLFPIGLIVILIAGGELITGNMMVVGTSLLNNKTTLKETLLNWLLITFANMMGAVFVALVSVYLGVFNGMEETLMNAANGKIAATSMQAFVSGMMCNWFVGLAVWLNVALKDGIGKIVGIWFPVMIFVYLGFQHSVANTFLLASAKVINGIGSGPIVSNLSFSYLGNIFGALIFVSGIYSLAAKD